MAKKINVKTKDILSPKDVNEILTVFNEVKDLIDTGTVEYDQVAFARAFQKGYGNMFTPDQQNSLMKGINFNPIIPTVEKIEKALMNAKENEDSLISYGQSFYTSNMVYRRTIDYLANLNNWDLSIQCINASSEDYNKPSYKKDDKIVEDFLNKFDYRYEFDKAVNNMFQNETYFSIFRDDMNPDKYVLQDFPYKYSKLVGRSTHGLLYDIDFSYFMQPQVDINLFPKVVKTKYNKIFNSQSRNEYIPSNELLNRNGQSSLWKQTSQADGFWAFKLKSDSAAQIPYLSPIFADMILVPLFRKLQVNQSMSAAKKIITSRYPLLKESKTSVSDMLAVKPEIMAQMMGAASRGLSDAIGFVNMPSDGYSQMEWKNTAPDDYTEFLKGISNLMGGGNSLFQSTKSTQFESQLALNIDMNLVSSVYSQFENFLDFNINRLTKKFKFSFKFSGSNIEFHREKKSKLALEMAAVGIVSPNKIANALDMNRYELERELDMAKATGFSDKLIPMLNMFTQTGNGEKENPSNRPKTADNELTEAGVATRENASNET